MPTDTRGAIVRSISAMPGDVLQISRVDSRDRSSLPLGGVLLTWATSATGGMDVTAQLGLPSQEVLLGRWPGLHGEWSPIIHPTVYEAIGLCAALHVATDALNLANHLATL
ncbi:hypothetical protein SAMN05421773_104207 [Streptomyces aidingensis]|uniref:Esterase n=2 Tax=Streptomyces aidingensis TaxID=910347 RepID=A0A1I1KFN8_9ACTN|nr:hypothetical protein SAMN05421773_104207 [Streptomyces aidingensis]